MERLKDPRTGYRCSKKRPSKKSLVAKLVHAKRRNLILTRDKQNSTDSTEKPPVETPAPEVTVTSPEVIIKSESVSSEDSCHLEYQQSDTVDGLQSKIETSETQLLEQPIAFECRMFDQIPGPSQTNISEKRKAEETITSASKYLRVTDIESALQKLEEICDKVVNITPEREDSFDHFGKYVASLLRTVPSHTACQLQEQIIGLIMHTQHNSK